MDQIFITAPPYPPSILLTGIIVNKLGQRFVAEDSYHSRTSGFIMDQPDQRGVPDRRRSTPRASRRCRWCHSSTAGRPSPRWRPRLASRQATWSRRWTATTPMRPAARTPTSTSSRNSLRHKTKARGGHSTCHWAGDVRRVHHRRAGHLRGRPGAARRRQVMPGLYAVGACASNIAQDGKGYASGTQLGEGSFFGRRAGAHAAAGAQAR